MELILDGVLQVVPDVRLAHCYGLGQRHRGLPVARPAMVERALDHADLRAVTVADDDLVPSLDEAHDGLGDHPDRLHELVEVSTQGVSA